MISYYCKPTENSVSFLPTLVNLIGYVEAQWFSDGCKNIHSGHYYPIFGHYNGRLLSEKV